MDNNDSEPRSNVIPFAAPKVSGDDFLLDEDTPEFADLAFVAERFMLTFFDDLDWSQYKNIALAMFDESDAETVVRLMQGASVRVSIYGD